MHRRSIHVHGRSHFNITEMLLWYLSGFSIRFQKLSRAHGQVTYVLLTRSPLDQTKQASFSLVRLACIRHAASVHPEPGSNSPFDFSSKMSLLTSLFLLLIVSKLTFRCFFLYLFPCTFFPVQFSKIGLHRHLTCSSILPNTSPFDKYFFYFF